MFCAFSCAHNTGMGIGLPWFILTLMFGPLVTRGLHLWFLTMRSYLLFYQYCVAANHQICKIFLTSQVPFLVTRSSTYDTSDNMTICVCSRVKLIAEYWFTHSCFHSYSQALTFSVNTFIWKFLIFSRYEIWLYTNQNKNFEMKVKTEG